MAGPDQEIRVALAVVCDPAGQVLIGRRATSAHLGGLCEFPGGKVEVGETPAVAMVRELREETRLVAQSYRPLMTVPHYYPADAAGSARRLELHVFLVTRWRMDESGLADGWCWSVATELNPGQFPAANAGIIKALKLPTELMITADLRRPMPTILAQCKQAIHWGVRLVCLRDPQLSAVEFQHATERLLPSLQALGCQVIVNCPADLPVAMGADGVHLNSQRLMTATERPVESDRWCSAACHDGRQLQQAIGLGVDFVTLSPVLATATHPGAQPLGWREFARLATSAPMPVYALGGMGRDDLHQAWQAGAQGIAGIGLFDLA